VLSQSVILFAYLPVSGRTTHVSIRKYGYPIALLPFRSAGHAIPAPLTDPTLIAKLTQPKASSLTDTQLHSITLRNPTLHTLLCPPAVCRLCSPALSIAALRCFAGTFYANLHPTQNTFIEFAFRRVLLSGSPRSLRSQLHSFAKPQSFRFEGELCQFKFLI
jgi:hypothetical protein